MKRIIVTILCSITLAVAPQALFPQAGTLDDTFSNDGIGIFSLGSQGDIGNDVVALADSTILVSGFLNNGSANKGFILRVLNNGLVDPTFGTNGLVEFQLVSGYATTTRDMIVLADNKIVVAGHCNITTNNREFFIARFLPDGSPDYTFNSTGYLIGSFSSGYETYWDMVMQPDGKFVLAGKTDEGLTGADLLFMRVNANGTIDNSFGTNGYTTISASTSDEFIRAVDVLSNGAIVGVGSYEYTPGLYKLILVKLTPSGDPMPGFGTNGVLTPSLFNNYTDGRARGVVVRNDSLLITGYFVTTMEQTFLAKLDAEGNADAAFGTNGMTMPDIGMGHFSRELFRQQDGKIYVCGRAGDPGDFILYRFTEDGHLDPSFNNTGYVITAVGNDNDGSFAIDLQPNGKIVLSGSCNINSYQDVSITRYLNDCIPPEQAATPVGNELTCNNASDVYSTEELEAADWYEWTLDPAEAGTLAPSEETVTVSWNPGFSGNASLSVHGANGCFTGPESEQLVIHINSSPVPIISGSQYVVPGSTEQYQTEENTGNTYAWEVTGGSIISGGTTHQVTVQWGAQGEGTLTVTEASPEGCSGITNPYLVVIDVSASIGEGHPEKLLVFPNPADQQVNVSLPVNTPEEVSITITSLEGRVVYSADFDATEEENLLRVHTADLKEGMYILNISSCKPARLIVVH